MVEVRDMTRKYGAVVAADSVSFEVHRGEMFGLIGPDGAGKTTTLRVVLGLLAPTAGSVRTCGLEPVRQGDLLSQKIGYLSQRFSLYGDLSVDENISFFASIHGVKGWKARRGELLELLRMTPFRKRLADRLSGGMKQKLALCCALVHRPEILFLDEPTTGVDAVSRREFWDLLGTLRATGQTTVVSTPYMDEADRCDRVALMQGGALLAVDAPSAITAAFGRPLLAVRVHDRYAALQAIRAYPHTSSVYPFGEALHYTDDRTDLTSETIAGELAAYLATRGLGDATIAATAPTIEDAFIARMRSADAPEAAA
jgi:ABC-2 type transport system ATP-binding protein